MPAEASRGEKTADWQRFSLPNVRGEELFLKKTAGAANLFLDSGV
jgi:hypothetical protein